MEALILSLSVTVALGIAFIVVRRRENSDFKVEMEVYQDQMEDYVGSLKSANKD